MKLTFTPLCLSLLLAPAIAPAADRETTEYHPALSDTFFFQAGAYFQNRRIQVSARGGLELDDQLIDFDETFKGGENQNIASANLHWNFGQKWWLEGELHSTRFREGAELEEDIEWNGLTFPAGGYAKAGVDTDLYRVLLGRTLFKNERSELSAGFGVHWMKLAAFIEGEAVIGDETTGQRREAVSASAPLPNISLWYLYSWSSSWAFHARYDWFRASIKEYSGGLTNTSVGVNWAFSRHFGASLAWKKFTIDVDVEKRDWYGQIKHSQSGPFLALTSTW